MFKEMLTKYVDRFGENFPTFYFKYATEAQVIEIIEECLKKDEPVKLEEIESDIDI